MANITLFKNNYLLNYSSSCGGTLIDSNVVLTVAHCLPTKASFIYNSVYYVKPIRPNSFYPTYSSMFSVYLGK